MVVVFGRQRKVVGNKNCVKDGLSGVGRLHLAGRMRVRTNGFILCRIDSFITLAGLFCVQKDLHGSAYCNYYKVVP
jgi:hypothetical protein